MNLTLLKKFVSFISIFLILFCNMVSTNVLAETKCPDLNNKGQIADLNCAMDLGKELIIEGKKSYIKMDNVGANSEYTLYFFAPSKISEILSQLEAPMDFDTFKMQEKSIELMQREKNNKIIEKISNIKNYLSSFFRFFGFGCGVYAIGDIMTQASNQTKNTNDKKGKNDNKSNENNKNDTKNIKLTLSKFIALTAILPLSFLDSATNLVGNIVSSLVTSRNDYSIAKQNSDNSNSYLIEKNNYFSALRKILGQIKLNTFDINKFLCLEMNKDSDNYMTDVYLFNNEYTQYTESEKLKLDENLEILKNGIEKILAKNK